MDLFLLKEAASYMSESLINVINKSLKCGVFNRTELHLSIWMIDTLMMKIIIDQYLP